MQKEKIISRLSQIAATVFPNNEGKVFLYGSQARGDENANSDWDLLILTKNTAQSQEEYDKYVFPFAKLGWDLDVEIIPINYSEEDWELRKNTLFYHNVMHDAIKL